MSNNFAKRLVNEMLYGEDCITLDDVQIQEFIDSSKSLQEASGMLNIAGISDEGLYDFFIGFSDYKRVTDHKAKLVLGWPVINYMLNKNADDPFFDFRMITPSEPSSLIDKRSYKKSRADSVTFGGAINTGSRKPDNAYKREMSRIAASLGQEIISWMGIGKDRKSQVVVIPTNESSVRILTIKDSNK
jgi:hypothetical protein